MVITAREFLAMKPDQYRETIETMSWTNLREVAETMHRCARRLTQLSGLLGSEVEERKSSHSENAGRRRKGTK
jgi:hypothetical protein